MYLTSPSWTISSKNQQSNVKEVNPSPFSYHPDKWVNDHSPAWKIGTYDPNKQNKNMAVGPGPGQYQYSKMKSNYKLGIFNHQTRIKQQNNKYPSPNQYSPNYKYSRPSSPTISISAKQKQSKRETAPGPGQYCSQYDQMLKNRGSVKIGRQKRFVTQKVAGPGPQAYEPVKNNFKKISIGFSREDKRFTSYDRMEQAKAPGPGQYNFADEFDKSIKQKKGYTIPCQRNQTVQNQIPGPGQYSPITTCLNQGPKISMKSKYKQYKTQKTPGPAQYSTQVSFKNKSNGFTIGKQPRGINQTGHLSGPGAYDPIFQMHKTPMYSLHGSRAQTNKSLSPGPGAYNPNKNLVKTRPQSAKIGTSKRTMTQKQVTPGPSTYEIYERSNKLSSKFSKQKRDQKFLALTPGPGQYNIKPIIGQPQPYVKKL